MLLSLTGFCALIALIELDTTYVGQFLISRPFFVGTILGALTGNLFLGLQVGIFTELIFIDYIPIGGVVPPSGTIASAIAILMNYFFKMDIYFAFFVGIVCGQIFVFLEKYLRNKRSRILNKIEKKLSERKITPGKIIFRNILMEFFIVFVFLLLSMIMFGPLFVFLHNDIRK